VPVVDTGQTKQRDEAAGSGEADMCGELTHCTVPEDSGRAQGGGCDDGTMRTTLLRRGEDRGA
jgi:hypothetical protein